MADASAPGRVLTARAWRGAVFACFVLALAVRVGSVLGRPHLHPAGDPAEYWLLSNYVAEGKGWIEPIIYKGTGLKVETAKLPPLYTLTLIPCSLVGFKSYFAHRIWSGLLSATAAPVAALLGRRLAGPAVGLLTAFGVALYPNLWMPADVGLSETISPILALLVLLAAYRMWARPTVAATLVLGCTIGLAALARDELIVFVALILLPLAVRTGGRWRPAGPAIQRFGLGLAGVLVVVMPWVGFNLWRFSEPVLITDRFGTTLASADCPTAWNGEFTGYWLESCALSAAVGTKGDEPAQDNAEARVGLRYVGAHLGRLPLVEAQRLGRTFAFWRVGQQAHLDAVIDERPKPWIGVGLWSYYVLLGLAPYGLVCLRRRRVPLFPLVAVLVDVVLVVLVTYGQTRFRATLEPVLVLLAAVAVHDAARRAKGRAALSFGGGVSGLLSQQPHGVERRPVPRQSGGPAAGGFLHPSAQ